MIHAANSGIARRWRTAFTCSIVSRVHMGNGGALPSSRRLCGAFWNAFAQSTEHTSWPLVTTALTPPADTLYIVTLAPHRTHTNTHTRKRSPLQSWWPQHYFRGLLSIEDPLCPRQRQQYCVFCLCSVCSAVRRQPLSYVSADRPNTLNSVYDK